LKLALAFFSFNVVPEFGETHPTWESKKRAPGLPGTVRTLNHNLPSGKRLHICGKSQFLMELTILMAIFNSYVKLPEGIRGIMFFFSNYIT